MKNRSIVKNTKKTDIFSLRMNPRLRYAGELLARQERRTLSSLIEFSLAKLLGEMRIPHFELGENYSYLDAMSLLWCSDESERFLRLATYLPDYLTLEERKMWDFLRQRGITIKKYEVKLSPDLKEKNVLHFIKAYDFDQERNLDTIDFVKSRWDMLEAYGYGEISESQLENMNIPDELLELPALPEK